MNHCCILMLISQVCLAVLHLCCDSSQAVLFNVERKKRNMALPQKAELARSSLVICFLQGVWPGTETVFRWFCSGFSPSWGSPQQLVVSYPTNIFETSPVILELASAYWAPPIPKLSSYRRPQKAHGTWERSKAVPPPPEQSSVGRNWVVVTMTKIHADLSVIVLTKFKLPGSNDWLHTGGLEVGKRIV